MIIGMQFRSIQMFARMNIGVINVPDTFTKHNSFNSLFTPVAF